MKTNKKRVERLERQQGASELPPIAVVFVDTKEQVDHPERFRRVLESEDVGESGAVRRIYNLERI